MMDPGDACVGCHARGEGGIPAFAGTVYPSAHEPTLCLGADGTRNYSGAQIVVTDATGASFTAPVNAAGNFYTSRRTTVSPPLKAKIVFMGRERQMLTPAPTGDCNSCHTQDGATTVAGGIKAPGRIILP
jgi:hypothetical protein